MSGQGRHANMHLELMILRSLPVGSAWLPCVIKARLDLPVSPFSRMSFRRSRKRPKAKPTITIQVPTANAQTCIPKASQSLSAI